MLGAEVGAGFAAGSCRRCQCCLFCSSPFPSPGSRLAAAGSRAHEPLAQGPSSLWGSSGKLPASTEPCSPRWGWPGTAGGRAAFFACFALGAGKVTSQDSQPYGEALTSGPPAAHCPAAVGSLPGHWEQLVPLCSHQLFLFGDPCQENPGPANGQRSPRAPGSISG